jgi:hypothetical protein
MAREIKHTKEEIIEEVQAGYNFVDQADDMLSYSEWQDNLEINDRLYHLLNEIQEVIDELKENL